MRTLHAEAGAWIWAAPTATVTACPAALVLEPAVWQGWLAHAGTPQTPVIVETAQDTGLSSALFVPVEVEDWRGRLCVARANASFQDADLLFGVRLADLARLALVGVSRQERSERARIRQLQALRHVTDEITATLDLDHILHVVLDEALRGSEADAGLIVLLSTDGVRIPAAVGYGEARLAAIEAEVRAEDGASELRAWLESEQTLVLTDAGDRPEAELLLGGHATLVVPIHYGQQLAGAILLQSSLPGVFGAASVAFVEGLSGQAAIAVGNADRYQEQLRRGEMMRQRAEQMSLLLEVSRTMRSDRLLEDILLDVAYAVQEGTGFELVLISVLEGNALRRVAGAGIPLIELEKLKKTRLRWERVRRLCQERFQLGQCYYIPEQFRDLTEGLDAFIPEGGGLEAGVGLWHKEDAFFVPLRGSADDILGIMSVDLPRDGLAPTAMTAEVVEIFASQVAQIIENHRLVDNLRRQVTALQLFNELNRSITTKLDLPLVLNTVVQSVTNLLGYDFSTIFLRGRDDQVFVPMASSGYTLDYLADAPINAEVGFIREVIHTGMPVVVEDALGGAPADADARSALIPVPIGSSIVVPLVTEGRSVGVLTADRRRRGEFSPADVATLTALADQVSVAVENARLFDEVKRLNEQLEGRVAERTQELAEALERLRFQRDRSEVLYHIASELVASLDMDRVLSQALLLLQRAVRASRSSVILLDATGQLITRAATGHREAIPPGGKPAPFDRAAGVVGWVIEKRASVVIPDTREEARCTPTEVGTALSVMAVPILGAEGMALGVLLFESPVVNVFDETQLRLVEAAAVQLGNALSNAELYRLIREQAERLGAMLREQLIEAAQNQAIREGIADGVMVADTEGRVMLFNAAAERILSITRQQALGQRLDEILGLYGSEVHEWLAQISEWRADPQSVASGAFLARRLTVGRRYVSVHLSPVVPATPRRKAGGGEFLGVVSVFRDITSEIEADRAKSDFVSTVSHELRTPMTSIVGYVELMLQGAVGRFPDVQVEFLRRVKTNADRLTNLVNDLLDISRIEQGHIELLCRPMSMEEVLAGVIDGMQARIEEKQQLFSLVVPAETPKIYGDPDRLAQILTNLLSNAHKYTPVDGHITIYAYVRDAMMHVAVADSGIGIASENQKRIFERFYRVENDPAVYEVSGTGLGLAISLSLIQMHGGSIWLESEVGLGSTFTFSLPLADGEPTADIGKAPPPLVTQSVPTVLVVEDDVEVLKLLQVALESEGLRVLVATSGEAALQVAREKLPDFISLDLRLPDLDGLEVLQLLKRDPETADIPVVIVSVVSDRERGLALGALDYVTKPVDGQRLLELVRRTVQGHDVVLLVGARRESQNRLRSALQLEGITVRTTMSGDRALRLTRDLRPAMVVLDLGMMDGDGYQLLHQLKRDRRTSDVPVVAIFEPEEGGHGEFTMLRQRFEAPDGVRFVAEPFSVEQLVADISAVVRAHSVAKES